MDVGVKTGIARTLDGIGVLRAVRYARASSNGIILALHRVLPRRMAALCYDPHLMLSAEVFEGLLALLAAEYEVVPLKELAAKPGSSGHRQRVAITFDDGWEDTYSVALPLLEKYGMTAAVFICTELTDGALTGRMLPEERFARIWQHSAQLDESDKLLKELQTVTAGNGGSMQHWSQALKKVPMDRRLVLLSDLERTLCVPLHGDRRLVTWDEVRQMASRGIAIGSHTRRHCTLTSEDSDIALQELGLSRQEIKDQTGVEVIALAYPNGAHDERIAGLAKEAGFSYAVTTNRRHINAGSVQLKLPRMAIDDLVIADAAGNFCPSRARLYLHSAR